MSMSAKNFVKVASIIKDGVERMDRMMEGVAAGFDEGFLSGYLDGLQDSAEALADYFAEENPRFDREKFLTACGLG